MKYLCILFFFSFCNLSFTTVDIKGSITCNLSIKNDTLPDIIFVYDTTIIFDHTTYTEKIKVVKSAINLKEYISDLNFSGKRSSIADTVTYTIDGLPYIITEERRYTLPVELWSMFHRLRSYVEKKYFTMKYGQFKVKELKKVKK